jgi:hypothetical protein
MQPRPSYPSGEHPLEEGWVDPDRPGLILPGHYRVFFAEITRAITYKMSICACYEHCKVIGYLELIFCGVFIVMQAAGTVLVCNTSF